MADAAARAQHIVATDRALTLPDAKAARTALRGNAAAMKALRADRKAILADRTLLHVALRPAKAAGAHA